MTRALLGIAVGVIAVAVMLAAWAVGQAAFGGALLLNLGTEVIGIAVTVAIVDLLLERRRDDTEAKAIGWRALHELDHAVWVWQGGRREYSLDELWELLQAIADSDPITDFTENLLLNIGGRADNTRRFQTDLLRRHAALERALGHLSELAAIRDEPQGLPASAVRRLLQDAVRELARCLQLSLPREPTGAATLRDPTVDGQERRHYGRGQV